jgi:hypothetical protein
MESAPFGQQRNGSKTEMNYENAIAKGAAASINPFLV